MNELASLIGGRRREGDEIVADINPAAPDERVAMVSLATTELAAEAVEAAAAAFTPWRDTPPPARGDVLRSAADLVDERADAIGRDLAREEGKTLAYAIGETRRAGAILRYYAGQTLEPDGETYPSHSPLTFLYARREPLGVVLAITPWNFPIAIPAWKIAPAIAFGNTVVWKPAEIVPLTSTHFATALSDAGLPDGVLNLVLGRGSVVGDTLVAHDRVDAVTFTGSNPVGRALQLTATEAGKKVQLELGGKNPAVVLADADLELAAEQVARGAFLSAGQKCTATSRVIVEQPVLEELGERVAALARSWPVGDPLDEGVLMGPLVSRPALERFSAAVAAARAQGGEVRFGGRVLDRPGNFVEPTLIVAPRHDAFPIAWEETFAPILYVFEVADVDEALRAHNAVPQGLSSAIFTDSLRAAERFLSAAGSDCGIANVNAGTSGAEIGGAFGGEKDTGGGRESGSDAWKAYMRRQTSTVNWGRDLPLAQGIQFG